MKQYLDQQGVEYLWSRIRSNFANLSNGGKVPASQLPSYVDDVEEYGSLSSFPKEGESGKIYVALDTNLTYRWSGQIYVEVGQSLTLGETPNTAYPGDKGKQLDDRLTSEVRRATDEEADIRNSIQAEQNRAIATEKQQMTLINKNSDSIQKEVNERKSTDSAFDYSLKTETINRQNADDQEQAARKEADANEKAERQSQDNLIKSDLEKESNRAKDAESTLTTNLNTESNRAKKAESDEAKARNDADEAIKALLNNEVSRAKAKESELQTNITNEQNRATQAESDLSSRVSSEVTRATEAESTLKSNIDSETSRAKGVEDDIKQSLKNEAKSREDADNSITSELNKEISRAKNEEASIRNDIDSKNTSLSDKITKEANRATSVENSLQESINQEVTNRQTAVSDEATSRSTEDAKINKRIDEEISSRKSDKELLNNSISSESERAKQVESSLTEKINKEISDREKALQDEIIRAKEAEQALEAKVGNVTIEKVDAANENTASSYQLKVNNVAKGVTIDIPKDQTIKDVEILDMNATLKSDGTIQAGNPVGSSALCISYIMSNGSYKLAKLDYSKFLEEAEFADGLTVKDHKVYVLIDTTSEKFLTVTNAGIKLSGVQSAIDQAIATEKTSREQGDKEVKDLISSIGDGSVGAVQTEVDRAKAAEAEISGNLNSHIKDYNNPHKVTKDQIGLSNVDNTSDADKPVSDATKKELDLKANQTDVTDLQQTITNLQSTIQQLQTKISNMSTTIESVQNNVTNIQNTVNTLPTTANNDAKYLRKDKDDVTSYAITAKALYKA